MPVVLSLPARSLSIEPPLGNRNYVAVVASPCLLGFGPLREQADWVRPGSNLLQAEAVERALSAEGRCGPGVPLLVQSPRPIVRNWLVLTLIARSRSISDHHLSPAK